MFRSKVFEPTLMGMPYRVFIEGLKSPVTKAAYSFALQKYMKYRKVDNPDDLLRYQHDTKIIQNEIIDYLIYLKNPPSSLRYATRSQYLAAIITLKLNLEGKMGLFFLLHLFIKMAIPIML